MVPRYSNALIVLVLISVVACGEGGPGPHTSPIASIETPNASVFSPSVRASPTLTLSPSPISTSTPPPVMPLQVSVDWHYSTNEMVWSLDVADLDGDGVNEVVAGSYDKHIYAFARDGEVLWSYRSGAAVYALDAGNLDGDGRAEVVAGGDDNRVHAIGPDGRLLWQYPTASRVVSVVVADVDGDGANEVLAASWGGQLYVLEAHGVLRWRLSIDEDPSAMWCADLDDDGQLEIVVGTQDGEIYVVGSDGVARWSFHTGGYVRELVTGDLDNDGQREVVVGSADGCVYALSADGRLAWRRQLHSPVISIDAADVDGDGGGEVLVGTGPDAPRVSLLSGRGEVRWSYPTEKSVWAVRGTDLDGDGLVEILAGGDDGRVRVLDIHGRLRGSDSMARRVHGLVVNHSCGSGKSEVVARSGNDVYSLTVAPADALPQELEGSREPATLPRWSGALPGSAESGEELIELVAVGDVMLSRTIEERLDLYGSDYPFLGTAELLRGADIAIGNLECPLSTRGDPIHKRFIFRAHPRHVAGLAWAGFDILNLANNHVLDFGREGFVETIEALESVGLAHVGAGFSYQEAHRPLIWEVKGKRVAFLAYAASRWRASSEVPTGEEISFADVSAIREDVTRAVQQADLVVVIMHLGTEYQLSPDEEQLSVSRAAIEAGACLVIGHHPHVVQRTTSYGGGFIVYSVGNFVFDIDVADEAREGAILRVLLGDEGVESAELIPVRIVDDVQPRFTADDAEQPVVERVF